MTGITMRDLDPRSDRAWIREAASLTARAFDDEPLTVFLYPRHGPRQRALRWGMRADLIDIATHGRLVGAFESDAGSAKEQEGESLVGIAAWLPPGSFPVTGFRIARQLRWLAAVAITAPGGIVGGVRMEMAFDRMHPRDRHWYLAVLAVDPGHHRRGIGRELLESVLSDVDSEGLPAYLETSTTANVSWYRRSGFELREEIVTNPGAPIASLLWREPRH